MKYLKMLNGKENFLNQLTAYPKRIFLIDTFGALLTTFLLFGILTQFEEYFGMPKKNLYLLSGIAFCLFIYSMSCYLFIKSNWNLFLKILIICNATYLLISSVIIIKNLDKLTALGLIYFILELIIIGIIIIVEYKTISNQITV